MSGAFSTVCWMVKRGAISMKPPIDETTRMAARKPTELRSSLRWSSGMSLLRWRRGKRRYVLLAAAAGFGPAGADGHPHIEGADHRAGEEEQAADGARDVIGVHRDHAFEEGILQRAAVI